MSNLGYLYDHSVEVLNDIVSMPERRRPYRFATLALEGLVSDQDAVVLLSLFHHRQQLEPPLSSIPSLAEDMTDAASRLISGSNDVPPSDELASLLGRAVELGFSEGVGG